MNDFFNTVNDIVPLKKEEQMALAKAIRIRRLSGGDRWVREGESAPHLAFISEGYLRKFSIHQGREVTDGFYFDNTFAGDLPGALARRPSRCNLVAMEPTELFILSMESLEAITHEHPTIDRLLRTIVEKEFLTYYYRTTDLTFIPPEERYLRFSQDHPLAMRRAEPYHIASFLGMTAGRLSRMQGGNPRPSF